MLQDNKFIVNKVCSFNTFPLWVKLRGNQNQGTPISNSSPRLISYSVSCRKLRTVSAMKLYETSGSQE